MGFGPGATDKIGINDLRFYVSNLRFEDDAGNPVDFTLDENDFQLTTDDGAVALIDMTGNTAGSCAGTSVAYAEGTARTNFQIVGRTLVDKVATVSFDVGVPQAVMKRVIADDTPEGAPSPLNEMYWSWNSGYRHVVFNFSVNDGMASTGAGYLHIGSTDCAANGGDLALSDRDSCGFVNTPRVRLTDFDLTADSVAFDVREALTGLDFIAPIYDPMTFEVIGEGPGVECHSSPMQPDCLTIFSRFGLDMTSGAADAAADKVFHKG